MTIQRLQDEVERETRRRDESFLRKAAADYDFRGGPQEAVPTKETTDEWSTHGGLGHHQRERVRAPPGPPMPNMSSFGSVTSVGRGSANEEELKEAIATAIVEENWDVVRDVLPLFAEQGRR